MPSRRSKAAKKYTTRNKVKIIRGGAEYFNLLLEVINRAE